MLNAPSGFLLSYKQKLLLQKHIICHVLNIKDVRHEKTDLRVFVVFIPRGPANPSLGMTPTIKYYYPAFKDYILMPHLVENVRHFSLGVWDF